MTPREADGVEGPMSFTRFVSAIYRMAPENPFNLPLPFHRRFPGPPPPRPAPVVGLGDRPLEEGVALVLFYQFLR